MVWDSSCALMKKLKGAIYIGGLLFMIVIHSSCLKEEVRLTREQLNQVDSMFLAERKVWLTRLEDSCEQLRSTHLNPWIDSLKIKRQREIEKMLGR